MGFRTVNEGKRRGRSIVAVSLTLAFTGPCMSPLREPVVAEWEPAPGQELTPGTQVVEIVVHEVGCADGDSAEGRIEEPEVAYTSDAVIVTVRVRAKGGDVTCPGNPLTPHVLELEEPLGERDLLDGGSGRPSPPRVSR